MQLLYGPAYTKPGSVVETPDSQGMRANKGPGYHHTITEYVTPWKTATVNVDGTSYFVATGQGHAVDDPQDPKDAAHVQSAYISAIWFAWKGDHWVMSGKSMNLDAEGAFGVAAGNPWTPFPQMAQLKDAALLVADEQGDMHQGYAVSWLPIYEFTSKGLQSLGSVMSGADNTAAGASPQISFAGKIVAATTLADGLPSLTISYSGSTEIENRPEVLSNLQCTFNYSVNPTKSGDAAFTPTTPQCAAVVDSGSF